MLKAHRYKRDVERMRGYGIEERYRKERRQNLKRGLRISDNGFSSFCVTCRSHAIALLLLILQHNPLMHLNENINSYRWVGLSGCEGAEHSS